MVRMAVSPPVSCLPRPVTAPAVSPATICFRGDQEEDDGGNEGRRDDGEDALGAFSLIRTPHKHDRHAAAASMIIFVRRTASLLFFGHLINVLDRPAPLTNPRGREIKTTA
jgi:hypothetical protein